MNIIESLQAAFVGIVEGIFLGNRPDMMRSGQIIHSCPRQNSQYSTSSTNRHELILKFSQ